MRAYTAIVNPTAGGAASAKTLVPLARALRDAGARLAVEYSRDLPHARELALEAAGRGDVVLAVGGDGMAGGVGGALVGTDAVLGIVPAGRGNDFARQIGLPTDVDGLADLLLNGEARPVDVLDVDGVHALGNVYTGVDAVSNAYANASRILRGKSSYTFGAVRAFAGWRRTTYQVTIDGERLEREAYTVVAANSGYYGFDRHIAPDASVDDGLLDVVIIRHAPRRLFVTLMNELESGAHVHRPEVEVLRGREVRIEASRDLPYGCDGELPGRLPVTVKAVPAALRVIRP